MGEARLVRAASPRVFFDRCREFLAANEAEYNLILGLAPGLLSGDHDYDEPIYLAWAEAGDSVRGVAFRTPPYKLSVGHLPLEIVPELVADLGRTYDEIPAVMGPEPVAEGVARAWAAPRGLEVRPGMRLRIHALTAVRPDLPRPPGVMRGGTSGDVDLVARWLAAFSTETGIPGTEPEAAARRLVDTGAARLWDVDGTAVSMAARAGATATAIRVGYVFTPPELRGRGYATALVADLSAEVLAEGRRSAFLYTDLANPTSNAIYARIGYEPVTDVADWEIGADVTP